jgi:pentose-5-phosphate-3-epimerase
MGSDDLGKHGVELENTAVEKIKEIKENFPETKIAIDIGVNLETKDELLSAGAEKLICGSAILDAENLHEIFEELSE